MPNAIEQMKKWFVVFVEFVMHDHIRLCTEVEATLKVVRQFFTYLAMSRVDQRPALRGDVALGFRSHDPQKWELFLRQDHASIARMSLTRSAAAGSSMIAPVALKDRAKSLNGPLMAARP